MRKAFTLIELMITLMVLASMGGMIALIIIGVHLLSKYW